MSAEIVSIFDHPKFQHLKPQPKLSLNELLSRAMVMSVYGTFEESGAAWTAYYAELLGNWPTKPCDSE